VGSAWWQPVQNQSQIWRNHSGTRLGWGWYSWRKSCFMKTSHKYCMPIQLSLQDCAAETLSTAVETRAVRRPLGPEGMRCDPILRSQTNTRPGRFPLDVTLIFRTTSASLAVAFVSGLAMAFIRFGSDRQSPPWLAKLHGFAAAAALALLGFAWLHAAFSRVESLALLLLLLAAAGGIGLNLGYHWKQKPLPEALLFAHMSVAFVGFLLMFLVTISRAA
jgi:hypothetical protein